MKRSSTVALRAVALVATGALAAAPLAPPAGAQPPAPAPEDRVTFADALAARGVTPDAGAQTGRPPGANPFLALRTDATAAEYAAWSRYLAGQAAARDGQRDQRTTAAEQRAGQRPALVVDEREPVPGSNDTFRTAQSIPQFGSRRTPRAQIRGSLDNEPIPSSRPNPEDDGSITLARDTGVGSTVDGFATSTRIGNGPHGAAGSGSGDFDVYEVHGQAGEPFTAEIDTSAGGLEPVLLVADRGGNLVAFADPFAGETFVSHTPEEDGDFYVFVAGFFSLPEDPFDSASGIGADSQGPYDLTIRTDTDQDVYAVRLRRGDTLGVSVDGGARFAGVLDPSGELVHGSAQDLTFIYPLDSPLPGGGTAVTDHVADEAGWHYVQIANGDGDYQATTEVYRPGSEGAAPTQTVFLDFDGARINTGIWGGPGVRELSPLRSFLADWGLTNADYRPLVRGIVANVEENLRRDMIASGVNPDYRIRVLNSLEHADPFGRPGVSRVIVGGTIEESGIPTIGIAQSIDPGNFELEESALVLLDILSEPAGEFGDASLNSYLRPRSDRVGFVAQALGNVTSHEAGHFFGDWHADQFNARANLMDQGGNPPRLFGVGPDRIGGTADDRDVDFGEDVFNPTEGFTGVEDTLSRIAAALTL